MVQGHVTVRSETAYSVDIVDRQKLEDVACECYSLMRSQLEKWRADSE